MNILKGSAYTYAFFSLFVFKFFFRVFVVVVVAVVVVMDFSKIMCTPNDGKCKKPMLSAVLIERSREKCQPER